jgi:hypothetical protein
MMNNEQMKYTKQRAQDIKSQKLQALTAKYTTKAVTFTFDEKLQAIKDGKYTTIEGYKGEKYGANWSHYIVFTDEKPAVTDTEGLNKAKAEINEKFIKLMDELMLGDSEEAINLLKAFEAL